MVHDKLVSIRLAIFKGDYAISFTENCLTLLFVFFNDAIDLNILVVVVVESLAKSFCCFDLTSLMCNSTINLLLPTQNPNPLHMLFHCYLMLRLLFLPCIFLRSLSPLLLILPFKQHFVLEHMY